VVSDVSGTSWCTLFALLGHNPRVLAPRPDQLVRVPARRARLSLRMQELSALENRRLAICRFIDAPSAPLTVARLANFDPFVEAFLTLEATSPHVAFARSAPPASCTVGGHYILVDIPVNRDTPPSLYTVQRWASTLPVCERFLSTLAFQSTPDPVFRARRFIDARPDTTLFCDWQLALESVQQFYVPTFPRLLDEVAFRRIYRDPCSAGDLLNPEANRFRVYFVDSASHQVSWTTAPFDAAVFSFSARPRPPTVAAVGFDPSSIPAPNLATGSARVALPPHTGCPTQ
jgi:hypothetical protein